MNTVPDATCTKGDADQLRLELSALIEMIDEMQSRAGPVLTARYQAALGRLELQLLELQIEVRSTRRRIEFLQSRVNRGESVTAEWVADIEQRIETELVDWRQVLTQEQALTEAHSFLAGLSFASAVDTQRVKAAYRQLARWLHPDASPENGDLFEKYWPSVQEAYQRIDLALIGALLHLVEHTVNARADKSPDTDSGAEFDRLRALIFTHAEHLAYLKTQPPHCYAALLVDDTWVAARQAQLEALIAAESQVLAQFIIRQAELMAHLGIIRRASEGGLS